MIKFSYSQSYNKFKWHSNLTSESAFLDIVKLSKLNKSGGYSKDVVPQHVERICQESLPSKDEWNEFIHVKESHKLNEVFCCQFQGAFAKFMNVTVSFVMSVCLSVSLSVCLSVRPSVCLSVPPHRTSRYPQDGFSWNLIFEYFFRKSVEKVQISLKSDNNNRYFTWKPIHILHHISFSSS